MISELGRLALKGDKFISVGDLIYKHQENQGAGRREQW